MVFFVVFTKIVISSFALLYEGKEIPLCVNSTLLKFVVEPNFAGATCLYSV